MPSTYSQSVTDEVRAAMARKGLKQWELAVQLDWSPMMLSRRMRGQTAWSTDDIEQLARVLGVPIHELVSPRAAAS